MLELSGGDAGKKKIDPGQVKLLYQGQPGFVAAGAKAAEVGSGPQLQRQPQREAEARVLQEAPKRKSSNEGRPTSTGHAHEALSPYQNSFVAECNFPLQQPLETLMFGV